MAEQPRTGRLATASIVGTMLEYYDFAIYNTLAALAFNRLFFPSFDPLTGTILAFSTFAVGYFSRPIGGVIFGHLGDRYGRRFVLVATLIVMGITTALIGALPTYAAAGVLSPVLLVALRFVQGAALGGEWAGAVLLSVEHGDQRQRGRNASWAQMGPSLGTLLATGSIAAVTVLLPEESFLSWGWRLPFFASVVLVGFGLWIRIGVQETPLFRRARAREVAGARAGGRGRSRALAQAPARRRRAYRARRAVFAHRSVLAFVSHPDARRFAHAGADRAFDRRRLQCSDDPDLRVALRPLRSPRDVRHRRGVRARARVRVLSAARYRIAGRHRVRDLRRADRARHDVRAAGSIHRRAVSDARALCRRLARVHAGGHRWRRHRAVDVRHIAENIRYYACAQRVSCGRIAHHRHRADRLHASAPASRSTSNFGSHP